jgi:hypothetical protein
MCVGMLSELKSWLDLWLDQSEFKGSVSIRSWGEPLEMFSATGNPSRFNLWLERKGFRGTMIRPGNLGASDRKIPSPNQPLHAICL